MPNQTRFHSSKPLNQKDVIEKNNYADAHSYIPEFILEGKKSQKELPSKFHQLNNQREKSNAVKDFSLVEKVDQLLNFHQNFKQYKISKEVIMLGKWGQEYYYDFVLVPKKINMQNNIIGVVIKEWCRSCGTQVIFKAETMLLETPYLNKIIVIGNQFSETARSWAKKMNIITLSRGEIVSMLYSDVRHRGVIEP